MPKVVWKYPDGSEKIADVETGVNLMEAAVANNVHGIVGECGGNLSCATCHVYVNQEWLNKTGTPNDFEDGMLDATETERNEQSRLSCQIVMNDTLDGIVILVPQA